MKHLRTQQSKAITEGSDLADENHATLIVKMVLASFPQQEPKDPKTYIPQIIGRCVGVPMWILREMVNPRNELLGKCKFLPTVAEVSAFIESRQPGAPPVYRSFESEPEFVPDSEEKRLEAVARWMRAKGTMELNNPEMKPSRLKWKQRHDPAALIRALSELERD